MNGIRNTIRIAGAYIAYMIGSGFATGQEIVQFFTRYGRYGVAGMGLTAVLLVLTGTAILRDGFRRSCNAREKAGGQLCSGSAGRQKLTEHYTVYCGRALGAFFEKLTPMLLFCTVAIMISGAGAAAQTYFGASYRIGCLLMAAVVFLSYVLGFHRLVSAIGFLGPVVICFMLTVGALSIADGGWEAIASALSEAEAQSRSAAGAGTVGALFSSWWFSALLYVSFNTVSAVPFLHALGASATGEKEAVLGGALGGVLLMTAALVMNFAIAGASGADAGIAIPTLHLARALSPALGAAFAVVLLIEIFSTAAPMMWTVCSRFAADGTPRAFATGALFIAAAYLLSRFPFEMLVGYVYPCEGLLGLVFLGCLCYNKRKEKKLRGGRAAKMCGRGRRRIR